MYAKSNIKEVSEACGPLAGPVREVLHELYRMMTDGSESRLDVLEMLSRVSRVSGWINCYPSNQPGFCTQHLLIFALTGFLPPGRLDSAGWVDCQEALEVLVRHVQGRCKGSTQWAVVLVGRWENDEYEKWSGNVAAMRSEEVKVVFILLGPRGPSLVVG